MNEEYPKYDQSEPGSDKESKPNIRLSPLATAFTALIGIFILYQVGGAILTLLILGFDFQKADMNATRLLTVGGQIMLMLLPTLLLARYAYPHHISYMLRVRKARLKEIGIFLLGFIILMPLLQNYIIIQTFILNQLAEISPILKKIITFLDELDKLVEKTYGDLLTAKTFLDASFIIIMAAIIPAICEEFLFRGLVQKSFEQRFKPLLSVFITALFFSLYHFNPYGLIPLFALGFYFGYAAAMSDSIVIPMVLHFTNNFLSVVIFLMLGDDEIISSNPKLTGSIIPELISFVILSIIFFSFIYYVNKKYAQPQPK